MKLAKQFIKQIQDSINEAREAVYAGNMETGVYYAKLSGIYHAILEIELEAKLDDDLNLDKVPLRG